MERTNWLGLAAAISLIPAAAGAHAVLERKEAAAGSYFKVVVAVAHGCEGSPTLRMRVRIPSGIMTVKPQPKPGWELAVTREKLANPVKGPHGATFTEAVTEVTWSGSLPDAYFDEFVLQVLLPDMPGKTLYFPTVQECERGVHRWIQIPAAGQSARELDHPAPSLTLTPARRAH